MDIRILGGDRKVYGILKLNEKEFLSSEEFNSWEEQNTFAPLNKNDEDFPYPDIGWFNGQLPDEIWDEEDLEDEYEELNTLSETDIQNLYFRSEIELVKESKRLFKRRDDDHLRFFVNQLFQIVLVAEETRLTIDPWKHICIGSDFDGLIKAIDSCKDTSELSVFGDRLIASLNDLADEANVSLPRSADELIKDILFNNAYNLK
jgi:hypothetical protein